jgi:hypothetical protein
MDSNTSSTLALVSLAVSVGGSVIALINHKRIRSTCCGRKGEVSLDIENTSQVKPTLVVGDTVSQTGFVPEHKPT